MIALGMCTYCLLPKSAIRIHYNCHQEKINHNRIIGKPIEDTFRIVLTCV